MSGPRRAHGAHRERKRRYDGPAGEKEAPEHGPVAVSIRVSAFEMLIRGVNAIRACSPVGHGRAERASATVICSCHERGGRAYCLFPPFLTSSLARHASVTHSRTPYTSQP